MFFKKFQKSKEKSVLGLSVQEINMRYIQGSFLSLAIQSPPVPTIWCAMLDPEGSETFGRIWIRSGIEINVLDPDPK